MQYRHEYKHWLNYGDYLALRSRLRAALPHDEHADENGEYRIRSLYFDDFRDRALFEKLDGVEKREKFRIRCYNGNFDPIFLEKKTKLNGLCGKLQELITPEQTRALIALDYDWLGSGGGPLVAEFCEKTRSGALRPKAIVDYIREPFVFSAGNVRVTLDRELRSALKGTDFFDTALPTIPADGPAALLEVKYDDFIPDIVLDLVQCGDRQASAFSKYAACRYLG